MVLNKLNKYIYESNHYDRVYAKNLSKRYMDKEDKIDTLNTLSKKTIEQMKILKEGGLI